MKKVDNTKFCLTVAVVACIICAPALSSAEEPQTTLSVFTRVMELSLDQALKIALENNPDLQSERKSLQMAELDIKRAKAKFDPYVQVDTSYSSSEKPSSQWAGAPRNASIRGCSSSRADPQPPRTQATSGAFGSRSVRRSASVPA